MVTGAETPIWWYPQSFPLAVTTAIVSTACWGSWSNTAKASAGTVNFAIYYADFVLGNLLTASAFLAGPGRLALGLSTVDPWRCCYAGGAGAVFAVANFVFTSMINIVGLSVAFPLCIGTGLALGTVLTYLVDRRSKPELLFPGVFLALLGVLANAHAFNLLKQANTREVAECVACDGSSEDETSSDEEKPPQKGEHSNRTANLSGPISLCVVAGALMGGWSPLSARSMTGNDGLSPYASFACFSTSLFLVSLVLLAIQQQDYPCLPRVDEEVGLKDYFRLPSHLHLWGILGGLVWATGTMCNLVSGPTLSFALSYALGQTAPVIAMLWGLLWYCEFRGAPPGAIFWLLAMFAFFISAIVLLVLSGS